MHAFGAVGEVNEALPVLHGCLFWPEGAGVEVLKERSVETLDPVACREPLNGRQDRVTHLEGERAGEPPWSAAAEICLAAANAAGLPSLLS